MIDSLISQIFSRLFNVQIDSINHSASLLSDNCFWVILSNQQPRWIIPAVYSTEVQTVLSQWRPYSRLAGIKWKVLLVGYQYGLLKYLPSIQLVAFSNLPKLYIPLVTDDSLLPVIYIGTPGIYRKAVATLLNTQSLSVDMVIKCPIESAAAENIHREALMLKRLVDEGYRVAPKLIYNDYLQGISIQQAVVGQLSGRQLKNNHIDFLLKLQTNDTTSLAVQCSCWKPFVQLLAQDSSDFESVKSIWQQLSDDHTPLPAVIQHGDFAPWNLKLTDCGVCAVDWEDSLWQGLPLQDLVHFLMIQSYLFKVPNILDSLFKDKFVKRYCAELSISAEQLIRLTQFYLISRSCELFRENQPEYAVFLLDLLCQTDWGRL